MAWILDPRLFNVVIMALYGLNILRWIWDGNYWAASYWGCALGLTVIITFGRTH